MVAVASFILIFFSCSLDKRKNQETYKQEIVTVEKDFESAVKEKGIAEAFYFYADPDAVIRRLNDSLIKGKDNIRKFYEGVNFENIELTWTPDFVGVSEDGTMGYTYGKFVRKTKDANGNSTESKGSFHTVWKKQTDGTWKYVWD